MSPFSSAFLQENALTGSLAPEWAGALPASLTEIGLGFNKLSGRVPGGWRLPSLQIMSLFYNQLTGAVVCQLESRSVLHQCADI